jgi:hypothetical protein
MFSRAPATDVRSMSLDAVLPRMTTTEQPPLPRVQAVHYDRRSR